MDAAQLHDKAWEEAQRADAHAAEGTTQDVALVEALNANTYALLSMGQRIAESLERTRA